MKKTAIILAGLLLVFAPPAAARGGPGRIQCQLVLAAGRPLACRSRSPDRCSRDEPGSSCESVAANRRRRRSRKQRARRRRRSAATTNAPSPAAAVSAAASEFAGAEEDAAGRSWLVLVPGRRRSRLPCTRPTRSCRASRSPAPATRGPAAAPLTPVTIAAHVADRMALSPGQLKASPSQCRPDAARRRGSGSIPAPATEHLSVSLAGEAVTVTAVPQIELAVRRRQQHRWRRRRSVPVGSRSVGCDHARLRHALSARRPGPRPLRALELRQQRLSARRDGQLADQLPGRRASRRHRNAADANHHKFR